MAVSRKQQNEIARRAVRAFDQSKREQRRSAEQRVGRITKTSVSNSKITYYGKFGKWSTSLLVKPSGPADSVGPITRGEIKTAKEQQLINRRATIERTTGRLQGKHTPTVKQQEFNSAAQQYRNEELLRSGGKVVQFNVNGTQRGITESQYESTRERAEPQQETPTTRAEFIEDISRRQGRTTTRYKDGGISIQTGERRGFLVGSEGDIVKVQGLNPASGRILGDTRSIETHLSFDGVISQKPATAGTGALDIESGPSLGQRIQTKFDNTISSRRDEFHNLGTYAKQQERLGKDIGVKGKLGRSAAVLGTIGLGTAAGFATPFVHPIKTTVAVGNLILHPVRTGGQLAEALITDPLMTSGQLIGTAGAFKVIPKLAKAPAKAALATNKALFNLKMNRFVSRNTGAAWKTQAGSFYPSGKTSFSISGKTKLIDMGKQFRGKEIIEQSTGAVLKGRQLQLKSGGSDPLAIFKPEVMGKTIKSTGQTSLTQFGVKNPIPKNTFLRYTESGTALHSGRFITKQTTQTRFGDFFVRKGNYNFGSFKPNVPPPRVELFGVRGKRASVGGTSQITRGDSFGRFDYMRSSLKLPSSSFGSNRGFSIKPSVGHTFYNIPFSAMRIDNSIKSNLGSFNFGTTSPRSRRDTRSGIDTGFRNIGKTGITSEFDYVSKSSQRSKQRTRTAFLGFPDLGGPRSRGRGGPTPSPPPPPPNNFKIVLPSLNKYIPREKKKKKSRSLFTRQFEFKSTIEGGQFSGKRIVPKVITGLELRRL